MARGQRTLRVLLAVAAVGVLVTIGILAWLGGAGRGMDARTIVDEVPSKLREAQLDQAEKATRAGRDAARKELERLDSPR